MASNLGLLSDDLNTIASSLDESIRNDRTSVAKKKARKAQDYYDFKHDIQDLRIFYVDDNGKLKEDEYASNVKISHPFLTELVDQKVQYLLSNPIEFEVEDELFQERLEEYHDEDFQLFLQELVEGASVKASEYAFARTNSEDRLCFQVSDSLQTFAVYDDNNVQQAIIRYYDKDIVVDNKKTTITYAERWNDENVAFFKTNKQKKFIIDDNRELNPRPHVIARDKDGNLLERSYNVIPFYQLYNNKRKKTDLAPIKSLIDDYDLMACFLSNNLQDFADAIYVVKGYPGDDLSTLKQNLKAKKAIGVSENGGVEVQTVEIPVEARKTKLNIDKEGIYHFGMGFDSTQVGDGNITNIVIKSRYALLDMKANKTEPRLRALLKWVNEMIVADINRRFKTTYDAKDITVNIVRETMVNETDLVTNEKTKAETKQLTIATILAAAPRIDDESTLKLICDQFDLDWADVQKLLEEQDYKADLTDGTDPLLDENGEVIGNGATGQVE